MKVGRIHGVYPLYKNGFKFSAYFLLVYNITVKYWAHGQCKNSLASVSSLITLDRNVVTTLDMLEC